MFNFQSVLITDFYNGGYNWFYPAAHTAQSNAAIPVLPKDVIGQIFSNLNSKNIGFCSFVCKDWNVVAKPVLDSKKAELYKNVNVFTPEDWIELGEQNFIKPEDIQKALSSFPLDIDEAQCPTWPEKKLSETHIIVWLPNGQTINSLVNILKQKCSSKSFNRSSHYSDFCGSCSEIVNHYSGSLTIFGSGWFVTTKYPIPVHLAA